MQAVERLDVAGEEIIRAAALPMQRHESVIGGRARMPAAGVLRTFDRLHDRGHALVGGTAPKLDTAQVQPGAKVAPRDEQTMPCGERLTCTRTRRVEHQT